MVSLFKTDGRRGEHVRFASDEEKEEKQITQKRPKVEAMKTMRMDADGCRWMVLYLETALDQRSG